MAFQLTLPFPREERGQVTPCRGALSSQIGRTLLATDRSRTCNLRSTAYLRIDTLFSCSRKTAEDTIAGRVCSLNEVTRWLRNGRPSRTRQDTTRRRQRSHVVLDIRHPGYEETAVALAISRVDATGATAPPGQVRCGGT